MEDFLSEKAKEQWLFTSNPVVGAPASIVNEQMIIITMVLADEELET